MKRTKIVCTLGPASSDEATLRAMIEAGMDVARLNFSHGSHESHRKTLDTLRRLSDELGRPVAALGDLQGPKIRVGSFRDGGIHLVKDQTFTITTRDVEGDESCVSTSYKNLPSDVEPGETLLLADGNIELSAVKVTDTDVICRVVVEGPLSDHKGINLPETRVSAPSLTEKDLRDLDFAIENHFDMVALSFVRKPRDILDAQRIVHAAGKLIPVIAKIERAEAVERLDDIIDTADGVMIARGDLGVELPPETVPVIQKRILSRCNELGVPVITATQMLESMIGNPRPTRAEASDVANAIFDGSDAIMLSGETAVGEFPVRSVEMMARIARTAEASHIDNLPDRYELDPFASTEDAVAHSAARVAELLDARLIAVYTVSGSTAARVSKYRPRSPIFALTCSKESARSLALRWGVTPVTVPVVEKFEELFPMVEKILGGQYLLDTGDSIVITAGVPLAHRGTTNTIKVHRVSGEHARGEVFGPSEAMGISVDRTACIACGLCTRLCPEGIFELPDGPAVVAPEQAPNCLKDGICVDACPVDAISIDYDHLENKRGEDRN